MPHTDVEMTPKITRISEIMLGDMICVDKGVLRSQATYGFLCAEAYLIVDIEKMEIPVYSSGKPRIWLKIYGLGMGEASHQPPILVATGYEDQLIDDRYAGIIRDQQKLYIPRRTPAIKKNKLTMADVIRR